MENRRIISTILLIVLNYFNYGEALTLKESNRNPTLLISFSGFRADKLDEFLRENPDSNIQKYFVNAGIKAEWMVPSFPANSFPNSISMMTGLYPGDHGIIGNKYFDAQNNKLLLHYPDSYLKDQKYWNSSIPIWLTANQQNVKTASSFYMGSEVITRESDIILNYDETFLIEDRFDGMLNWFKKFQIDFGTFFYNEPFQTGYNSGPETTQYKNKIKEIDVAVGTLMQKLEKENLLDKMNIIVLSDSGMATYKKSILFKDNLSEKLINFTGSAYDTVSHVRPSNDGSKTTVYDSLKKNSLLTVYYKEDIPQDLNFNKNKNIGSIVAICNEGYSLERSAKTNIKGLNGYDNKLSSMRTIFLARGPDFKANVKMDNFENVNVYSLLCYLLKIECLPSSSKLDPFLKVLNGDFSNYSTAEAKTTVTSTSSNPIASSSSASTTSAASTTTKKIVDSTSSNEETTIYKETIKISSTTFTLTSTTSASFSFYSIIKISSWQIFLITFSFFCRIEYN